MLRLWKAIPHPEDHEDLFIERYELMRRWSLHLTENDHGLAEDLVHDAFIQFTFTRPNLSSVQNLDGYLYAVLRNLRLSQIRKATRSRTQQLSIVEYDSAEAGLRTIDARDLMDVEDDLRRVCQYACVRKETSKAGSVLILRFFHGYYPSEISKILQSTRRAVDLRLRVARGEAKLYLSDPNQLGFMGKQSHMESSGQRDAGIVRTPDRMLNKWRESIFRSRCGDCLSKDQLKLLYHSTPPTPIDCASLGHIVSCPNCLDEVNALLGLPPLSERHPIDMLGPDAPPKDGPPPGAPSADLERSVRACRRRARDVFEHRPQELHISVNGFVLGSQKVNAEMNELTLDVNLAEKIDFVEVFSEQENRLLLFNAGDPPPAGPEEQSVRVELSDNRALEMTLNFRSPWPTLHAVYYDPLMKAESSEEMDNLEDEWNPSVSRVPIPDSSKDGGSRRVLELAVQKWRRNVVNRLRTLRSETIFLRPGAISAMLAVVLIAALVIESVRVTSVSAAELLHKSAISEQTLSARPGLALHQIINLEERTLSDHRIRTRRRIEVWHSAARETTARRVYNERGRLIAGEWTKADGSSRIYHPGAKPESSSKHEDLTKTPFGLDNVWRLDLSAQYFTKLIGLVEAATVEKTSGAYRIDYQQPTSSDGRQTQRLLKATLELRQTDLHPTELTLLVQPEIQMDLEPRSQPAGPIEYRFTESTFEQQSLSTVPANVFEPEAELLGLVKVQINDLKSETQPSQKPPMAAAELKLEVTYLLNQINATLGNQVSVSLTPDGKLHINGIVETDERKAEILKALAPFSNNPAILTEVMTVAEALERQQPSSSDEVNVQDEEIAKGATIPVYSELRRYFSPRIEDRIQLEEEIRQFSNRMMDRSSDARSHAWVLKRLVSQFSQEDLRRLSPTARAKWLSMIREHAQAHQQATSMLRRELEPIFYPAVQLGATRVGLEIRDEDGLGQAVERLFELSIANADAIQASFSISTSVTPSTVVKTQQFWESLRSAEQWAASIQATAQKLGSFPDPGKR